jgi:hypothetical protein
MGSGVGLRPDGGRVLGRRRARFRQWGPFVGRDAIGEAYRTKPPDDQIVLLDGDGTYAWASAPEVSAGQLFLTERDGEIARLVIRYDRD